MCVEGIFSEIFILNIVYLFCSRKCIEYFECQHFLMTLTLCVYDKHILIMKKNKLKSAVLCRKNLAHILSRKIWKKKNCWLKTYSQNSLKIILKIDLQIFNHTHSRLITIFKWKWHEQVIIITFYSTLSHIQVVYINFNYHVILCKLVRLSVCCIYCICDVFVKKKRQAI